jgi:hypothetical protein
MLQLPLHTLNILPQCTFVHLFAVYAHVMVVDAFSNVRTQIIQLVQVIDTSIRLQTCTTVVHREGHVFRGSISRSHFLSKQFRFPTHCLLSFNVPHASREAERRPVHVGFVVLVCLSDQP